MTRTAKPLGPQLKLSLLSAEDILETPVTPHELKLALIELLTTAACAPSVARDSRGHDDESEAHR